MNIKKETIDDSWKRHRGDLLDRFQKLQRAGQGITITDAIRSHRSAFEAGANAMLDAFQAELLNADLERLQQERAATNVIGIDQWSTEIFAGGEEVGA